jgi:outer membrane protein insertion porin family
MRRKRIPFLVLSTVLLFTVAAEAQFRKAGDKPAAAPVTEETLNYANPQEYFIAGIEVSGLNVLDKNAMVSLTGLKIGDKIKIPGEAIARAIKKLWGHKLLGDIAILVDRIEGQNVYLIVKVTERPRLTDFYFTGISKSQQTALKEDLKLIKGKIVNDATIRNAELSVRKHFTKKGFLNTKVKITQVSDTLNRGGMRLKIDVSLKSKVKINAITFSGNNQNPSGKLRKEMKKTHERARISLHRTILASLLHLNRSTIRQLMDSSYTATWQDVGEFFSDNLKLNFLSGSKFIKSDYDADKLRVIEYLNTQGFRDSDILHDTLYNHDENSIDINITVTEGHRYYFRNITWTGNYLWSAAALNKILDIKKGDVYNRDQLDRKTTYDPKGGGDIGGLYMDDGYLFFKVTPVEVAVSGDSIDVEMRISEGDQARLDEIIISGNERTNDHVIRRELSTIPGQKFRRSDLIRTQQMLSQMGYFNPQKISQDIRPNPSDGTVDIEWKVDEQSNDQVELSGGWGGYYGFVGTVGLAFNNFSARNIFHTDKWRPLPVGDGQKLALRAQANGRSYQSYSLSFTEPWLGGRKPNSLTVSLNHSISKQPYGYTRGAHVDYTNGPALKQSGLTVGVGRRLTWPDNYFSLTNSFSFLIYNYVNNYFRSTAFPANGTTYSVTFNTTLARNSIDNPMYPTSGSAISLSLSLTPPYSLWRDPSYLLDINERYKWIEFNKWMFDSKYYIKLLGSNKAEGGRSLVVEAKAHMGLISTYTRGLQPGPFERFIMGGAGLAGGFNSFVLGQEIIGLRGYQDNLVTPPLYAKRGTVNTNQIDGGTVYDKFGLELRYPITTGSTATIYGLLFAEGGNNWNNLQEFNPFKMYRSTGVGVRLFMPAFGLIGLNWAYGYDTLPGSSQRSGAHFHFTIGQQIR